MTGSVVESSAAKPGWSVRVRSREPIGKRSLYLDDVARLGSVFHHPAPSSTQTDPPPFVEQPKHDALLELRNRAGIRFPMTRRWTLYL